MLDRNDRRSTLFNGIRQLEKFTFFSPPRRNRFIINCVGINDLECVEIRRLEEYCRNSSPFFRVIIDSLRSESVPIT